MEVIKLPTQRIMHSFSEMMHTKQLMHSLALIEGDCLQSQKQTSSIDLTGETVVFSIRYTPAIMPGFSSMSNAVPSEGHCEKCP